MSYDKRIRKHVLKRRFTVTKTKAIVGFLFSTLFSVLLSTYFEEYGRDIYSQTKQGLFGIGASEKTEELILGADLDSKTKSLKKEVSWDEKISDMRELNSY